LLVSLSTFFLPLPPPPPGSTLFPYTTLFRSLSLRKQPVSLRSSVTKAMPRDLAVCGESSFTSHPSIQTRPELDSPQTARSRGMADRKSTRLNSSHVKISYAVFCLKKKKRQT